MTDDAAPEQGLTVGAAFAGCHRLLLRLAGRVPDRAVTEARIALAAGELGTVTAIAARAAAEHRVPLGEDGFRLLGHLLAHYGLNTRILGDLIRHDADPAPGFWFTPDPLDSADPGRPDDRDRAVVEAVARPGTLEVRRAWRFAETGEGKRVYLIRLRAGDEAAMIDATLDAMLALVQLGEPDPQVEAWPEGEQPPAYQQAALAGAMTLWTDA